MKITLVCNCGLLIEAGGAALLIDAPCGHLPPFGAFPEEALRKLLSAQPPYDRLAGVCFTHRHPDHYDAAAVERLRAARPDVPVLLPEGERGTFAAGAFTIEYAQIPHVPVPAELMLPHWALLVCGGGRALYITADAVPDADRHRAVLAGRTADAAFWNSQVLAHPETRALLNACARRNFIYHIPTDTPDPSGIRRKCERDWSRRSDELPTTQLLYCGGEIEV